MGVGRGIFGSLGVGGNFVWLVGCGWSYILGE